MFATLPSLISSGDNAGSPAKPSLLGLPRRRLAAVLEPYIDQPYRIEQIYRALYVRRITDFTQMTDLGSDLREQLGERFTIELPSIARRETSDDGTVKYLLQLHDGATVEAVDIPERGRRTLCLSSQAGCALACGFCVTGYWGSGRNLTAGEIVSQLLAIERRQAPGAPAPNLVFMGMGEPLLNLEHLANALEILMERISWRRITISTAGVIPGIEALASWHQRPRLAISLHAPDDRRRSELMPINRRYPLAALIETLARFPLAAQERLTFEYLLLDGFNSADADADMLARLLRGLRAKVNLIPFNPDPVLDPALKPPDRGRVEAFRRRLISRGLVSTIRRRRGGDVSAACGQLRAPDREPRGLRRLSRLGS